MKKAVDCGYWNLFRFNPAAHCGQEVRAGLQGAAGGYQEFLMNEARYSRLTREFPERAGELFERNELAAMKRYEHLLKLKEVYAEALGFRAVGAREKRPGVHRVSFLVHMQVRQRHTRRRKW